MTIVKIQVQRCQAGNTARWALDRARARRRPDAPVSDPCVVKAPLALAAEDGVTVEFYDGKKRLDLAGVKKVLEGKEVEK